MTTHRTYFIVGALQALGDFYRRQGNYTLSNSYFKNSIELADSINDYYDLCATRNMYAVSLLKQNQWEEAKEQALQSFFKSRQHRNNDLTEQAAGLLKRIFDIQHITDSAYYYSQMESAMRDSLYNQDKLNKMQEMGFSEKLRTMEEDAKKIKAEEQQKENIQYALIALGIVTFIILFLLLSRSIITNTKLIEFLGVMALLIVFEFLNLVMHPFLEKYTHNTPSIMLLLLVCIAAILIPLHHRLEKWATHRLVEKNKQIRLAAAKKTIEKLENEKT
jgi:hypothetical protein